MWRLFQGRALDFFPALPDGKTKLSSLSSTKLENDDDDDDEASLAAADDKLKLESGSSWVFFFFLVGFSGESGDSGANLWMTALGRLLRRSPSCSLVEGSESMTEVLTEPGSFGRWLVAKN